MPRNESVVSPPSHCPNCDHKIKWYENIPLLSWIFLRGKCSGCHAPISVRYFSVELLTGLLFLAVWYRIFTHIPTSSPLFFPVLIIYFYLTVFIVLTSFIDYDHRIIPNKITYPAIILGFVISSVYPNLWPLSHGKPFVALMCSTASVVVLAGGLLLFAKLGKLYFKKDALGWGDIKYIAAIAAILGPYAGFFSIFIGSLTGGLGGLLLVLLKKGKLRSGIPLGPHLAFGTFVWMMYGPELVKLYFLLINHIHQTF